MFEGTTQIKFSKEAAKLMMSKNLSDMFHMPLDVSEMDYTYSGLEVTFGPPQENEKKAVPETLPNTDLDLETVIEDADSEVQAAT